MFMLDPNIAKRERKNKKTVKLTLAYFNMFEFWKDTHDLFLAMSFHMLFPLLHTNRVISKYYDLNNFFLYITKYVINSVQ